MPFVLCSVVFMRAQLDNATQASPLNVLEGVECTCHRDVSPKEDAFSVVDTSRFARDKGGLFSTRMLRKESRKSSGINKSAKIGRHTFRSVQDRNPESEQREPKDLWLTTAEGLIE